MTTAGTPREKKSILIVEDEEDVAATLQYNLEREGGYKVTVARTGESGLALASEEQFDLVLLDLMLPGLDGIEVCRALRSHDESFSIPILMLTARVDEIDRLVGLEVGADDYITKPFSMKEVLARVKAHLRRSGRTRKPDQSLFRDGPLTIDFQGHIVTVDGSEAPLTRMEFALLSALVQSRPRVLTRGHLLERVWGYEYGGTRTVDVHIRRLRQKLGTAGEKVETVFGVGYRFREAGETASDD